MLVLLSPGALDSYAAAGARIAIRTRSPHPVCMRSKTPYDSRSVTESFEMWSAAPPAGFTWGYDSRSTTENYEQWLASVKNMADVPTSVPPPPEVASAGVPSVTPSVYSWYDSGIRLSLDETDPNIALTVNSGSNSPVDMDSGIAPTVVSWYDSGIRLIMSEAVRTIMLTPEQLKAYGGPSVRPLTFLPVVLTPAELFYSKDAVELTEQQVKAYGGPALRPFTYSASVTSWYDAGIRLTWPMVGGSAGYHRMAGRLTRPEVLTKPAPPAPPSSPASPEFKTERPLVDVSAVHVPRYVPPGTYSRIAGQRA